MVFLRKLSLFRVISLSFHKSSCVNVEGFSFIVTACTISVITVYNTPLKNHNVLMQQYFSTKFIEVVHN